MTTTSKEKTDYRVGDLVKIIKHDLRHVDKIGLIVRLPLSDSRLKIFKVLIENKIIPYFQNSFEKIETDDDHGQKEIKKEKKG